MSVLKRRVDRRSVAFGLAGIVWGCVSLALGLGSLLSSIAVASMARVACGQRIRAAAFGLGTLAPFILVGVLPGRSLGGRELAAS